MATVSNPYTFKITGNKTVKCTISASVPVTETMFPDYGSISWNDDEDITSFSITIPSGVTIIKIAITVSTIIKTGETGYTDGDYHVELYETSPKSSNDLYYSYMSYDNTTNSYYGYFKVTAGKTYSFDFSGGGYGSGTATAKCYYSQFINSQTSQYSLD